MTNTPDIPQPADGNDPLAILLHAHGLISDSANWCQGYNAHPDGRRSVVAAVGNILWKAEYEATRQATHLLARAVGRGDNPYDAGWVQHFNDHHTHAEVLALIDKAMAICEADRPYRPPRAWVVRNNRWRLE